MNATVDYNYVHDNYNVGIWFDFLNSGADISYNYISSNWSAGIQYEASYNARIADNTLVGNSWPSDGPWPAGVKGGKLQHRHLHPRRRPDCRVLRKSASRDIRGQLRRQCELRPY